MNCHKCKHHGTNPGTHHLRCRHPKVGASEVTDNPLAKAFAILAGVDRCGPTVDPYTAISMGITINEHGFRKGWANWPWNFDPIWINTCNCYEEPTTGVKQQ